MIVKNLSVAATLFSLTLAAAVAAAQAGGSSAHQNKPAPAKSASKTPAQSAASSAAAPATPNTVSPATPGASTPEQPNPGSLANCPGGSCDTPTPHITIATPAPAPAPWPLQDRILWVAQIVLVLVAYVGVMIGLSILRKIERQSRFAESAAQAATESAKAALLLAEAQQRAERPWVIVSPDPVPGTPDAFTVVAMNRGRGPARIVSLVDEIVTARDETALPPAPAFRSEPRAPRVPIILLPGESTGLKSFRRDDVRTVCESAENIRRVEEWDLKIYLYGAITYADLRSPSDAEVHQTSWCCWYIHGHQKSGMVVAGPPEYNVHT
ncbi:MAG: hypothetical protein ABSF23_14210 [Terracidiphilus sp.]|jgi:flagellar basal body-associated protein FliL